MPPKKDISECNKLPKPDCEHNIGCTYVDGKTRKYCRAKPAKPDAKNNVTKRVPAAAKPPAAKPPAAKPPAAKPPAAKKPAAKPPAAKPPATKRVAAAKRVPATKRATKPRPKPEERISVHEFMTPPEKTDLEKFRKMVMNIKELQDSLSERQDSKKRAVFLKSVCSNSGVCIAFGIESNRIKKHFDNFNNFNLLTGKVERMGEESVNGFVKRLTYEKHGYVAQAILKSSVKEKSDNLLYEGIVGQFLNKIGKRFPSFLETYGVFRYTNTVAYNEMKDQKSSEPAVLHLGLQKIPILDVNVLKESCSNPLSMSVLIQNLDTTYSIASLISDAYFLRRDLITSLYQVYSALSIMSNNYTHNDLHTSNVLLYEPVKGSYIQYYYHTKNGVVSFKSRYIVKIIDYGRCYFHDSENNTVTGESTRIYNALCSMKTCRSCGKENGYHILGWDGTKNTYYISTRKRNVSNDLRLLYMIKRYLEKKKIVYNTIDNILNRIVFEDHYGTKGIPQSGLPAKIHNVTDAYTELENVIRQPAMERLNDITYTVMKKLGDLHIYLDSDRPMNYIPLV
jgi:hypothetical protein